MGPKAAQATILNGEMSMKSAHKVDHEVKDVAPVVEPEQTVAQHAETLLATMRHQFNHNAPVTPHIMGELESLVKRIRG